MIARPCAALQGGYRTKPAAAEMVAMFFVRRTVAICRQYRYRSNSDPGHRAATGNLATNGKSEAQILLTTAHSGVRADFRRNRLVQGLALFYAMLWAATAVAPLDRFDWFLENLLVFLVVGVLVATYRRFPLSDLSYLLLTVFLSLHTIGAHYTYSETPIGFWLRDLLELGRNHYDRIVHFCFGLLLAYPLREVMIRGTGLRGMPSYILTLTLVVTASAGYEVIEWVVAEIVSPQAAYAYLGTQGDPFDAQKDMGLALSGVTLAVAIIAACTQRPARRLND